MARGEPEASEMTTHSETRRMPYSARQLFDLVADVERYPEFLPWCQAARIRSRRTREDGCQIGRAHV